MWKSFGQPNGADWATWRLPNVDGLVTTSTTTLPPCQFMRKYHDLQIRPVLANSSTDGRRDLPQQAPNQIDPIL